MRHGGEAGLPGLCARFLMQGFLAATNPTSTVSAANRVFAKRTDFDAIWLVFISPARIRRFGLRLATTLAQTFQFLRIRQKTA